jgi:S-adenosylmethionine:tRNA ribosyltransferase-isomerase
MKTKDFFFDLPEVQIAQKPTDKRTESRLLVLERKSGGIIHTSMKKFSDYVPHPSCLVVNNSKVRKARLFGKLESGIDVEILFLEEAGNASWSILSNKTKRLKPGRIIRFRGGYEGTVVDNPPGNPSAEAMKGVKFIRLNPPIDEDFFITHGHVPLPPYISRLDTEEDISRYQTVYAEEIGSVAAPTAGLHFTESMLESIRALGSTIVPITLHVGTGTFLPVRSELIADHNMHFESYEITSDHANAINRSRASGKKLIAVGTTSVRTLESAADSSGRILPGRNKTNLFITPGYSFKVVDCLLTNFHTPESTLLMLVSAFAGYDAVMHAYHEAVRENYRFFSYGDAMLII